MKAVMRSCVWRETERTATLAALAVVGVHPEVFLSPCDPATREEGIRTALQALAACRGGAALILEDDIEPSGDFPTWLRIAQAQDQPVTFCTMRWHMLPRSVIAAKKTFQPLPTGLYPVRDRKRWWGSQAIYLPAHVVELALTSPYEHVKGGFDNWLRGLFLLHGLHLQVAVPNPVQHRDPRPTFGHPVDGPRRSNTYGMPGTLPLDGLRDPR